MLVHLLPLPVKICSLPYTSVLFMLLDSSINKSYFFLFHICLHVCRSLSVLLLTVLLLILVFT